MFKKLRTVKKRLSANTVGLVAGLNVMALSLLPGKALAVLPAAADVADGASTTSPIQLFRDMGTRGVTIGATVIAAIIVLGVGFHVYGAFTQAREKNDWKPFGITASLGVVIAASSVLMSLLAVQYAT